MTIGKHSTGQSFTVSDDARDRHVHVVGQTGVGKSALLLNMIAADLEAGNGVGVIDPHGELAGAALSLVSPSRFSQVRYLNPADLDRPIGFNPLHSILLDRRAAVTDEITAAFRSVWGWSPETAPRAIYILTHAVRTALDMDGATMLYIPRLLTDSTFRRRAKPTDPVNRQFWADFDAWNDRYRLDAIQPVLTRFGSLLESPAVRNTLCQRPRFDLAHLMNEGQILICNLDKGKLGELNSHLLGAFLVSGIVQAAMNRPSQFHQRRFYLFVDEFQNFATESFSTALSEARKYGLSLTLAHQYTKQLPDSLLSAVLGNTGTTIVFRVGAEDADLLAAHTGGWVADYELAPRVLKELPNFHCVARVLQGGSPQAVRLQTLPPPALVHDRADRLIRNSRTRFGRPRSLVEAGINQFLAPKPKARNVRKWS